MKSLKAVIDFKVGREIRATQERGDAPLRTEGNDTQNASVPRWEVLAAAVKGETVAFDEKTFGCPGGGVGHQIGGIQSGLFQRAAGQGIRPAGGAVRAAADAVENATKN